MAQVDSIQKTDETFLLEIVSPERVLNSKHVKFAVLPAVEGGIGVLPGHSPLLTALKPGVIEVHGDDDKVEKIFVAGGFLEVNETQCIALAVDAIAVEDISSEETQETLERLKSDLEKAQSEAGQKALEKEISIYQARLESIA